MTHPLRRILQLSMILPRRQTQYRGPQHPEPRYLLVCSNFHRPTAINPCNAYTSRLYPTGRQTDTAATRITTTSTPGLPGSTQVLQRHNPVISQRSLIDEMTDAALTAGDLRRWTELYMA